MSAKITINSINDQLISKYSLDFKSSYQFIDCRIDVVTNSKELKAELDCYFINFKHVTKPNADYTVKAFQEKEFQLDLDYKEKAAEPGKSGGKEAFIDLEDGRVVLKLRTGLILAFGKHHNLAIGDCVRLPNQVINFINNRFIADRLDQGQLLFHAAGLDIKGQGVALCGLSGGGKSTLALKLMDYCDAKFVSNDRILGVNVENGRVAMSGVAKYPRVNPGTILNNSKIRELIPSEKAQRLDAMPLEELWQLEDKYDVDINKFYGEDRYQLKSYMDVLVILNWSHQSEQETQVKAVDLTKRSDLFPAFMKSAGLFYLAPKSLDFSKSAYLKLLSGVEVYEVTGKINFDVPVSYTYNRLKSIN